MAPDSDRDPDSAAVSGADPPRDVNTPRSGATASGASGSGRRRSWTVAAVVAALVVVGAVAVVWSTSDDDDLAVLRVGSQQRAISEMGRAMDTMWVPTRFELAQGLDIAAGDGPAWQWTAPSDADVADLAERLGLTGTPQPVAADEGGGWQLDALTVTASGDWSFANPTAPVPSADEALAIAERIVGGQVDASLAVVSTDPASVVVEVSYRVDDRPSGQVGMIAFGRDGMSGFGRMGTATFAGNYPTISAVDALERLNQPTGLGSVANAVTLYRGVASGGTSDAMGDAEPDAAVSDEFVQPQKPVVVFVDVQSALVPFYDADGEVWSLPGYEYADADGLAWTVVAVADEYLETGDDQPADSPVSGDEPGSSPGSPGDGSGDVIDPGFPDGQQPDAPDVVGRTEAEATAVVEQSGFTVRVVARDGEYYMITQDFRTDRVNLVVEAGRVTGAYVG
jgi:hypothetical protein